MAWENITPEIKASIIEYVNECESFMYRYRGNCEEVEMSFDFELYAARKWSFVHGLCVAGLFKDPSDFIQWLVNNR